MKIRSTVSALSALLVLSAGASANILNVAASQNNLSATASFEAQGANLIVTLSNVGGDVLVPADVLTAVFWDVSGPALTLTQVSAVLENGSSVVFDPDGQPAGGVVGGEWAYANGLAGPRGSAYGISSSGFGLFGNANFPGSNLEGPTAVNGMQYGLLSNSDNLATGNSPVTGANAFIKHSVVFTLSGLPQNFDPSASIRNVNFQYGTALTEPNVPTPGSTTLALLGAGLMMRRRRK